MSAIFRFPTTSIAISKFAKINELSEGKASFSAPQSDEDIKTNKSIDPSFEEQQDNNGPNRAIIKLLENKKSDLKKSVETLSNQIRTHIRHIEYIDSRISELMGENVDLQSSRPLHSLRLDSELCQTSFSRLSTTINTGVNTPNSVLANSNESNIRGHHFVYRSDGDWVILPEFKEIISRKVNVAFT
ncbi:hypothetical protein OIY81_1390 [Cryptosporidium canis]|uniref:t-SNARE coiled-coil homology domain-containing protein n=1 Tax=Cryptosporidium canis TaxID=195482 RepID=A0ABQ8P686_9CRYT|nr:hypothetical protein OJ252_2214 [Cryptosporidium canis]KAJ1612154.1 hypothetical protein OIY81_1390 [Cryptosporidium canis]